MNLRVLFCDDDSAILQQLHKMVMEYFKTVGAYEPECFLFSSGEDLLESDVVGDIAFLDIEMGGLSGIHTGVQLKKKCPRIKIIIVTSFPDYLDEAMKFHVFRYLSKPVDKNRLFRNLKDAIYQINAYTKPVVIETEDGFKTIYAEDIVCFESDKRRTKINTVNETIMSKQGIDYWTKLIDIPCFYSVSRSYIVNMKYVSEFNHENIKLICEKYTMNAYLARRRYVDFRDTYLLYAKNMI